MKHSKRKETRRLKLSNTKSTFLRLVETQMHISTMPLKKKNQNKNQKKCNRRIIQAINKTVNLRRIRVIEI